MGLAPGCRALALRAHDAYDGSNRAFVANPASQGPYFLGLGLGFLVGLPLCLISWPLTALLYPSQDGDEFFLSGAVAPALLTGTLVGSLLAAPLYPLGAPWLPEEPEEPDAAR